MVRITFKLYALLTEYLPSGTRNHAVPTEVDELATVTQIIERFNVPLKKVHLVLLNGVYLSPEERNTTTLNEGDTLAIWPPVAGG